MAHLASIAAQQQGKFWEMHDRIFANQQKMKWDDLKRYAREIGLDMARFEADVTSGRLQPILDADLAEIKALGVTGTPGFFINGRFLSGAKPPEEFARIIDEELAKVGG